MVQPFQEGLESQCGQVEQQLVLDRDVTRPSAGLRDLMQALESGPPLPLDDGTRIDALDAPRERELDEDLVAQVEPDG